MPVETRIVIVGGGSAGITAAIGLARRGIPVIVVEGGLYPGAENWSGAVYFCENLARPEILGEDLLSQTPLERRVVQRGLLITDGELAVGGSVRSYDAFVHCHTVLRPVFDHDLALKARLLGAEILSGTAVLGLIRDGDTVRGVLTDRGPIYADAVFLAEGDASHLVSREGLETVAPGADGATRPEFLQGIKEVLELPSSEIEARFGLGSGEGACFEILLRNGTVGGSTVPLNAGAFLYTNRDSLSLGLVAPLRNLESVGVPHNHLMEWLKGLPALKGLLEGARSVSFGAKLIRGGGWKEMPRLALDGLAVGGAASGIGVDFPCPNYTGPATFMGYAFSESVAEIYENGGSFDREAIESTYVRRVRESAYLTDVHHLREWPEFVSKSRVFFGAQADLVTKVADVATRNGYGALGRRVAVARTLRSGGLKAVRQEGRWAARALGLWNGSRKDILSTVGWALLNTVRGFWPRPSATDARFIGHFWESGTVDRRPLPWFWKFQRDTKEPGLAEALFHLYRNDGQTLDKKLAAARRAILSRISLWDVLVAPFWALGSAVLARFPAPRGAASSPPGEERSVLQLDRVVERIPHDRKLSWLTYRSDPSTHIHFHAGVDAQGLRSDASTVFHVCPANVYQSATDRTAGQSVTVLHENCIRCETCWRADDRHVDWGRLRGQRVIFEAYTEGDAWLRESREAAALRDADSGEPKPSSRRITAHDDAQPRVAERLPDRSPPPRVVHEIAGELRQIAERTVRSVSRHTHGFVTLLRSFPSVLTVADQALLQALGREVLSGVRELAGALTQTTEPAVVARGRALTRWAEFSERHLGARRFFHFETDIRLLQVHHGEDLRGRTGLDLVGAFPPEDGSREARRLGVRAFLDQRLSREAIAGSEQGLAPDAQARQVILELSAALRDPATQTPIPPGAFARDVALEELARRSMGLALVLSDHLQAVELVCDPQGQCDEGSALDEVREDIGEGRTLLGLARGTVEDDPSGTLTGGPLVGCLGGRDVLVVPTRRGVSLVVLTDPGVAAQVTGGIGLRSAGPGTIRLEGVRPRLVIQHKDAALWLRVRGPHDLVAVARGAGGWLLERALDHADSRVQFPGMFQDVRGRDGIVKFGAVQDMVARMAEGVEVLESLRHRLGSGRMLAAVAAEILGPGPRSLAYLAGQVLGGTAYSEEDPVAMFFRDAAALTRFPLRLTDAHAAMGERVLTTFTPGEATLPGLDLEPAPMVASNEVSELVATPLGSVQAALEDLTRGLRDLRAEERPTWRRDLGRLALQVGALRALADRVESQLARGVCSGVSLGSLEHLADRVATRATRLKGRLNDGQRLRDLGQLVLRGVLDGSAGARGSLYAEYLESAEAFASGDLVLKPGGRCLTPELMDSDPVLAGWKDQIEATWRKRFHGREFDGKPYTRHVEAGHQIPPEDVQWLVDEGYFRMLIGEGHGGQGLKKAAYYLACANMVRHGDLTQAIIVMGSTSIGTTPIFIGQDDLNEVEATVGELASERVSLEQSVKAAEAALKAGAEDWSGAVENLNALNGRLRAKVRRLLVPDLAGAVGAALKAAGAQDGDRARKALSRARTSVDRLKDDLASESERLPHRRAAHDHFLRLIAAGSMSAFALTEPSAGSDTARIRTRAERCEVPVTADPRGFWTFTPAGAGPSTTRNLFALEAFEWKDGELLFIRPDRHRVPVHLGLSGLASESHDRRRYVELDGELVEIHDVGRVEKRGHDGIYRYFRVNGAKMWITNASTAGVMILYARTEAGLTGFFLDAHAEGLTVGKDEEKMGQRGSATNELSLSDVRIPVDQIIGLEGRGQENALETLNVGRAGLAICGTALAHDVVGDLRQGLGSRHLEPDELMELGRIGLDLVMSESLAWQLVGRFDHPKTESVRVESAVAKAAVTEAYHRILTRAEGLLDGHAALDTAEMEKRRRDARVLTIYEGTSEIQRFLVLRDLVDGFPDGNSVAAAPTTDGWSEFSASRATLLSKAADLRTQMGSRAWQEVHLQPVMFPLVEAFMRLFGASAVLARRDAAKALVGSSSPDRLRALELTGGLLLDEVSQREGGPLSRHLRGRRRLSEGRDTLSAALTDRSLLRHQQEHEPGNPLPASMIVGGPLRVAVIVDPSAVVAPRPRVHRGALREHASELSVEDRGALQAALELRQSGEVSVTVLGAGRINAREVLQETLALGADHAFLVNTGTRSLLANDLAGALADILRTAEDLVDHPFDLVIGARSRSTLFLPLARRLNLAPVEGVQAFAVHKEDGDDAGYVVRTDRGDLTIEGRFAFLMDRTASPEDARYTVEGWRTARGKSVPVIDFLPEEAAQVELRPVADTVGSTDGAPQGRGPLEIRDAAERFVVTTGISSNGASRGGVFEGEVIRRTPGEFLADLGALAVTEGLPDGSCRPGARAAIQAAAFAAGAVGSPVGVLMILVSREEAVVRRAIAEVRGGEPGARVAVLAWDELARRSAMSRAQLIEGVLRSSTIPTFFSSELRSSALLSGEGRSLAGDAKVTLLDGVDEIRRVDSGWHFSGMRFDRKIRFAVHGNGAAPHVIVQGDAKIPTGENPPADGMACWLDDVPVSDHEDPLAHMLGDAEAHLGSSLAEAEFIIDVGYGVGSRDGIEEVVEPLKAALERLGVPNVTIGATRKVTQDLGILPDSCQIGQTGVSVNPKVMLCLGVSGAPQHLEYIGPRAVIFAFNKDPDAPLMVLNQQRPFPVVYPVLGDLFREVPKFVTALEARVGSRNLAAGEQAAG